MDQSLVTAILSITMANCRLFRFCELANIGWPAQWRGGGTGAPSAGASGSRHRQPLDCWRWDACRQFPGCRHNQQGRGACCHANIKRVAESMTIFWSHSGSVCDRRPPHHRRALLSDQSFPPRSC